jgi:hypothetical protein
MNINENVFKITGSASIPQELDLDGIYDITLSVDIKNKAQVSRDDGTFDLIHSGEMNGEITISDKIGTIIRAKKKSGSQAQVWNFTVSASGEDYKQFMSKMIDNSEAVIEFVKSL